MNADIRRRFSQMVFLVPCYLFLLWACASTSESESRLYRQVFEGEKGMFRGMSLGDKLENVQEKSKPIYEDILGAVYEIPFSESEKMRLHYYIDNLQNNKETNRIACIQAYIQITDEVETTRLYHQIQQLFTQKYGLPSGNYGALKWENGALGMEVLLTIDNQRKQISLAFVTVK